MWNPLPNPTGSCARGAKLIGRLGLVYQLLPVSGSEFRPTVPHLYQLLPPRRRTGHGSECSGRCGCHRGSRVKGGRGYTQSEWWYTLRRCRHHGGRYRKDFSEKIFFGRIAHKPYGGKTGRAMIKYPHIQKNAQRKNTLLYPGLTTVSFDRIITYMQYYYVLAYKGTQCFRYYCQLDPGSADTLHDVLVDKYDLVQVCEVTRSSVEPDRLISPAP